MKSPGGLVLVLILAGALLMAMGLRRAAQNGRQTLRKVEVVEAAKSKPSPTPRDESVTIPPGVAPAAAPAEPAIRKTALATSSSAMTSSAKDLADANSSMVSNASILKFKSQARDAWQSIPTTAQLNSLTDEQAHLTPESMQRAGKALGVLAQSLHDHPELAPQGVSFYEACALKQEFSSTVRALCYADLKNLLEKNGQTIAAFKSDAQIPEKIRHMSLSLQ